MTNTEKVHFVVNHFINESGLRLHMTSVPLATASVIYHKFFRENSLQQYDPYLIATTALYLAGKAEEQHLKLRDVVNVCYRILHSTKPPLEMGEAFMSLRDTVANCELFVLRMLQFKISFQHPHKYLLHYLKFLKDWFEPFKWETTPIARSAWTFLKDSYHGNLCLLHKPQHIAVGLIYMALECHGVEVPLQSSVAIPWWKVLTDDITEDIIKDIIEVVIRTYEIETLAWHDTTKMYIVHMVSWHVDEQGHHENVFSWWIYDEKRTYDERKTCATCRQVLLERHDGSCCIDEIEKLNWDVLWSYHSKLKKISMFSRTWC